MKGTTTITNVTGFGWETIHHGCILETGDGKKFKVVHPWWRRLWHWATFGRGRLHPSTVLTVREENHGQ